MTIHVMLPAAFKKHTNNTMAFDCPAKNMAELMQEMRTRFPNLTQHIVDETEKLKPFVTLYVNEDDIRFLGLDTEFADGDELSFIPAIAGG